MRTINVAIINNVSLQVVADDREQLVAVKPVCEILGVAYPPQYTKLKEHPLFSSVITLSVTTGSDGKAYEHPIYGSTIGLSPTVGADGTGGEA